MNKLNFGCGSRIAKGWLNVDFVPSKDVQGINLLTKLPYEDHTFDVVYSSHVLEHFTLEQCKNILLEVRRILKPNGIIRIAVPNLEETCREYMRILSMPDETPNKNLYYEWIMVELLDQMVRMKSGGLVDSTIKKMLTTPDTALRDYIVSRTKFSSSGSVKPLPKWKRFLHTPPRKYRYLLFKAYLKAISRLIPKKLRQTIMAETSIGERHQWMYDNYGMRTLLEQVGFMNCRNLAYNESDIPSFNQDALDCNADGTPYKGNTIYVEGNAR